jgi:hypothetical protein
VPIVLKSGNLNLLEPSGPVQACNRIALPFTNRTIKAVTNTEHCGQNFKNYFSQLSLFLYIQFSRLIALTPLEPSTSLTGVLCSSTFSPSLNTRSLLHTKHVLSFVSTRLSSGMPSVVLYKAYCMHGNFYTLPDNTVCLLLSRAREGSVMSRALRVAKPLGATAFCYNIMIIIIIFVRFTFSLISM